jgi:predicted amidohydrolase
MASNNNMIDVNLNVATYQGAPIRNDIERTFEMIHSVFLEAASLDLDLVLFPELFLTHYDIGVIKLREQAVDLNSAVIKRLQTLASTHSIAFAIGYPESTPAGIIYNSCCLFDSMGTIVLNYRKSHLWTCGDYETAVFTAGSNFPVAYLKIPKTGQIVKIGILICLTLNSQSLFACWLCKELR